MEYSDIGAYRIEKLKQWTGKESVAIIYDSNTDNLNARELNSKVCGKGNVSFIIMGTDDECFGCHHTDPIEFPKATSITMKTDNHFFLFAFTNAYNLKIKRTTRDSIVVHPNDDQSFVFTASGGFWIQSNGVVMINQLIRKCYRVPAVLSNPFCNKPTARHIQLERLLAVQWS